MAIKNTGAEIKNYSAIFILISLSLSVFYNKSLREETSWLQFPEHCGSKIIDRLQGFKLSSIIDDL